MAVPEGILPIVQSAVREATFLPLPEDQSGVVSAGAFDQLREMFPDVHAIALGPGLSTAGQAPDLVRRLVREAPVPLVIDADAINAFEGRAAEISDRSADAVITPHHGELGRLMGTSSDTVRTELLGSVRKAAREIDAPVLLKGWPTLLANPEGRVKIERSGTPVLATAGTGDVLTGLIAGFLAPTAGFFKGGYRRGQARPDDSAIAGAQVHGLAGQIAARHFGEGAVASDVADAIPEAIRSLREDV
jgi:NAD(P)H-hydrate epimerase